MDQQSPWKSAVRRHTSELGYRNWIVVAEASFPAFNRTGIRPIPANVEIPEALDYVLEIIDESQKVKPDVYVTKESQELVNNEAPGIDELREQLKASLHGMETTKMDQDSLVAILQDVTRSFDVLVVRTTTTLPYSSIFLELQPGYWDGDSEDQLRQRMKAKKASTSH